MCLGGTWVLVHIVLCGINILGAFYIACKFHHGGDPETDQRSGFARASYILCHDPGVAIFIMAFIAFFVWFCIVASSGCMSSEIATGFSYIGVSFLALSISLCCSCCGGSGGTDNNVYHIPPHTNPSAPVSSNNASSSSGPANQYQNQQQSSSSQQNDIESNKIPHNGVDAFPVATPVAQAEPVAAEVVPEPSAPPMPQSAEDEKKAHKENKAAASGSALGGKIGNLFNASDKTKANLESGGAKASLAIHKTIQGVKKMVK